MDKWLDRESDVTLVDLPFLVWTRTEVRKREWQGNRSCEQGFTSLMCFVPPLNNWPSYLLPIRIRTQGYLQKSSWTYIHVCTRVCSLCYSIHPYLCLIGGVTREFFLLYVVLPRQDTHTPTSLSHVCPKTGPGVTPSHSCSLLVCRNQTFRENEGNKGHGTEFLTSLPYLLFVSYVPYTTLFFDLDFVQLMNVHPSLPSVVWFQRDPEV